MLKALEADAESRHIPVVMVSFVAVEIDVRADAPVRGAGGGETRDDGLTRARVSGGEAAVEVRAMRRASRMACLAAAPCPTIRDRSRRPAVFRPARLKAD